MDQQKPRPPTAFPQFNQIPPEQLKQISRNGGLAGDPKKKSEAAKLVWMKKWIKNGSIKTKDPKWLLERLENRQALAADLMIYMDEIKDDIPDAQRIAFANTYAQIGKLIHGEKVSVSSTNVNINIDLSDEIRSAFEKRMSKESSTDADFEVVKD